MTLLIQPRRHWLIQRIILVFALFAIAGTVIGQNLPAISLFESDSLVHIRMTTDMKLLVKKKQKEEYQPARIEIVSAAGDTAAYDIKIKSRGETRKKVCTLPPIKVKFSKKDFSSNKLKWVLPCSNNDGDDQSVLKEYMAYQLYQILSDNGFKTELIRVEYIDTGRDGKSFVRYGFVIEDVESVADRIGGREYSPKYLNTNVLDEDQLALFNMFQYMIANTDWAIQNRHNLKAFTDPATKSVLIIPYDFDYAGFVDTHYAVVHESLPMEDVRERYNKGYCISEEMCKKYTSLFISKKEEILEMCRDFAYFNNKTRKSTDFYLKQFFEDIENDKKAGTIFCKNCKIMTD